MAHIRWVDRFAGRAPIDRLDSANRWLGEGIAEKPEILTVTSTRGRPSADSGINSRPTMRRLGPSQRGRTPSTPALGHIVTTGSHGAGSPNGDGQMLEMLPLLL